MTQKDVYVTGKCLSKSFNFDRATVGHDSFRANNNTLFYSFKPYYQSWFYFTVDYEKSNRRTFVCDLITNNNCMQIAIVCRLNK